MYAACTAIACGIFLSVHSQTRRPGGFAGKNMISKAPTYKINTFFMNSAGNYVSIQFKEIHNFVSRLKKMSEKNCIKNNQ